MSCRLVVAKRDLSGDVGARPDERFQSYFAGPQPPLRLMTSDRIGEDVIRLTYVPA
jgi:hypothetical protein